MRTRRAMVVLAAITLPMAPLPYVAASASPETTAVPIDDVVLPGGGSGQEALDELGSALAETAAANEMSTDAFTDVLRNDATANLDEDGRLFYVDPAARPPAGGAPIAALSMVQPEAAPSVAAASAVPGLHSRESSTHKIYLDFNGYTLTSASAWAPTIPATTYTGFSLDGSADFSTTEIDFIRKVHAIVSEKYAPFDVDVTTVDPLEAGIRRTSAADHDYGVHVVITNDTRPVNAICGGTCAGIAYTNVFNRVESPGDGGKVYSPAWVFASNTYGSAQMTAHDAAHEIGHTFGLTHDGVIGGPDYYAGHANWVPIMGITNQRAVAQFSKGEYTNANNSPNVVIDPKTGEVGQDDLAIIGENGDSGAPGSLLLGDDYPTFGDGAPPYPFNSVNGYAADGIIGSAADDDVFYLVWPCDTPMTVTATGLGAGQGVDLKLEIYSENTVLLASDDPASGQQSVAGDIGYRPTGMDAQVTIPTGEPDLLYGIRVDGVGTGTGATGYTDYGSIGRYHLEVSGCPLLGQPNAPGNVTATQVPSTNTGTISWTAPTVGPLDPVTGAGPLAATGYRIEGLPGGNVTVGDQLTYTATGLTPGTTYNLNVRGLNSNGAGPATATTLRIGRWAPTTGTTLTVTGSGSTAVLKWIPIANPGQATLDGWRILGSGAGQTVDLSAAPNVGTFTISGLARGTHTFTVTARFSAENGNTAPVSNVASVLLAVAPSAPRIGLASPGARGGSVTATARWSAPASTGGTAITSYRVIASRLSSTGKVVRNYTSPALRASVRAYAFRLPAAKYKFRVVAYNVKGASPASAYSRIVAAR